ncbi:MAG: hypothetical protein HEEMFOPI_02034 [Holosporales bacterium]
MRFFFLLMLISILKAAQPIDTSPLLIPVEFKFFIDAFKEVTQLEPTGQGNKTLRDVKEIMDPLRPAFEKIVTYESMYNLVKEFEEPFEKYGNDFEIEYLEEEDIIKQKRPKKIEVRTSQEIEYEQIDATWALKYHLKNGNFEGMKKANSDICQAFDFLREEEMTEKAKLLNLRNFVCEFKTFYKLCRENRADLSYFFIKGQEITEFLNFSKDIVDMYCPLAVQKMLFPFYLITAIYSVFRTCDLILDERDTFVKKTDNPYAIIYDVSDRLDEPFLKVYDYLIKMNIGLDLNHISRQRLFENIAFMLDHHVRYVDNKDEEDCSR